MKAQICMKSVAAGELNEAISRVHDGQGEAFILFLFFIVTASWNWILYESLFRKEAVTDVRCSTAGRTEGALFCLLSSSLTDWMSPQPAEGAPGRGFPRTPSLLSFSDSGHKHGVIRKKWGSGGEQTGGVGG